MVIKTNILPIKRSRTAPRAGDIFAINVSDDFFLFGRVIGAGLGRERAPMPGANLIYVYQLRSAAPVPDLRSMTPDRLLIPPVFINSQPWTRGYFLTVGHHDLQNSDQLQPHCFWSVLRQTYIDGDMVPLAEPAPQCGTWALFSYRWLDDQISDAVGIPRVPESAD